MKKENLLRIVFIVIFLVFAILAILRFKPVETRLLQGFVNANEVRNQQFLKLSNFSSANINVIFEGQDYDELSLVKDKFVENFNFENIEFVDSDFSKIMDVYKSNPTNFLSLKTRGFLENKDYKTIAAQGLERLYNPMGIYFQVPDKDPYLLLTDFVLSLQNSNFTNRDVVEYDGKLYSLQQLELKKDSANEIKELLELQKRINIEQGGKIYLTGTQIHSSSTSAKSALEINLICLISTIALILLCKLYFKSLKILIPIALSIIFGMFFGYLATSAILGNVHILTFVFSTTLIGISLDYSLHYFMARGQDDFLKNLTSSMLTTVLTFLLLLFSGVEILKQIAIFTSFGLLGVYSVVTLFFPLFKGFDVLKQTSAKLPDLAKYKMIILPIVVLVIIFGGCKISFNDDIRNLYTPSKTLLKAEVLYKKVFDMPEVSFLVVEGENYDEILEKEELIAKDLEAQSVEYYSFSKIFPSIKTQRENNELVKNLYISNLDDYGKFLSDEQRKNLKQSVQKFSPVDFKNEASEVVNKFFLDENTSFMVLMGGKNIESVENENVNLINISKNINQKMQFSRELCLKILPIMFCGLFIVLVCIFRLKKAIKIILAPVLGTCFAVAVLSILGQELNMFNILAMFLIVGFSVDYSIFRASGDKNSKDAVLISFISTAMSFLLLSFTSFKLISSLGVVLFLGIATSYILSLVLISEAEETDTI